MNFYYSSALDDLEKKVKKDDPELRKQAKETQFIRNKAKEYKSQVQKTEAALYKSGVDPTIYHQALVESAEVRISYLKCKMFKL